MHARSETMWKKKSLDVWRLLNFTIYITGYTCLHQRGKEQDNREHAFLHGPLRKYLEIHTLETITSNLDLVTYMLHLNMKYHNDEGLPLIVKADVCGASLKYEANLKGSLTLSIIPKEKRKKVDK